MLNSYVKLKKEILMSKNLKKPLISIVLVIIFIISVFYTIAKFKQKTEHQTYSEKSEPIDIAKLRALPYIGSVDIQLGDKNGVSVYKKNDSYPGYNLYSIRALSTAELIDMEGNIINSWSFSTSEFWSNVELLPNGDLLVVGARPPTEQETKDEYEGGNPKNRYLLRFDWKGNLLWKKTLPAHHDVELSPDGNILVLSLNRKIIPEIHSETIVQDQMLVMLDQGGNLIESKSLYDAVKNSNDIFPLQKVEVNRKRNLIDLFHANSIEKMQYEHLAKIHPIYNLDNIIVCACTQDRITIINWPDNKVIWTWGQNIVSGPHDASLLENGHILLFDNGIGRKASRIIELNPITKKIVWQYQADPPTDFYTRARGSAQRLMNGNTLVAESDKGRAFELTPDGKIVWDFLCPHEIEKGRRATIIRMKRYPIQLIHKIIKNNELDN